MMYFMYKRLNIDSFLSVERDVNGNLLNTASCELCNGNSPGLSVPNPSGDRYVSSPNYKHTDSTDSSRFTLNGLTMASEVISF